MRNFINECQKSRNNTLCFFDLLLALTSLVNEEITGRAINRTSARVIAYFTH